VDYAFYVTTDPANGEDIWVNFGNYVYSNQDISVEGGTLVYGKFGSVGVYTPYSIDMEFIYNKPCKSVARKPVIVTVNPRPGGSEIIAAAGYKGQEGDGTSSRPDISTPGLTLNYELTSPAGFSNAEYGSKWILDSVSLITACGKKVSSSLYSFTIPDSADNGFLSFTPDKLLLDSNIAIRLRCRDLGPYFCDTVITRVIHVAPMPKPGFKVLSTICEGSEVYFSNLSTIHSGRMNYKWYFSPTDSSDIFEPIHRFDSFGVYPVRLVVTSERYNIIRDTTIMVNINGIPDVDFSVENACEGNSVKFTNLTPGNTALMNFRWDFGDRTPFSTVLDPVHPYSTPGTYKVTLTASLNGCGDTIIKNAHLYSKPVVDFMPPAAEQCLGENWFFINNSYIFNGKMGALWDFSDGGHSTFFNATHMFTSTGTFPVSLKMISEFDCTDSLIKVINVKPIPVINFVTDKLCSLDSTRFTNLTNEIQGITSDYTWTFSDGPEQHTRNVSRKWTSHGPKTVKLVSSLSNGCRAEKEATLNVLIQPEANFNVKDICANENAVFVNTSKVDQGEMDFMWDFGDSSGIRVPNPKHQYTISKTKFFTVTLVAKADQGCSDTVKRIIRVHEVPDCGFTFSPFSPIGNKTFRFVPMNSTYEEYEWFFGEGGSSKNKTPIYQYLYNGSYTVVLRAKNSGGCICEQTIYLKVDLTGLSEKYDDAFSIYPNPADQFVSIRLKDAEQGTARIYNQLGQLVKTVSLTETTEIGTGELSPGIYVVEVILDDMRFQARITVVH
jgi:PKD repeat protein